MSDKHDFAKIVNKLSSFRSTSSELFDSQMALIQKILENVEFLQGRSADSLTEVEKGRVEFYQAIISEVRSCLTASEHFNKSLTKDYAEALKLLSKIHGGINNA